MNSSWAYHGLDGGGEFLFGNSILKIRADADHILVDALVRQERGEREEVLARRAGWLGGRSGQRPGGGEERRIEILEDGRLERPAGEREALLVQALRG